MNKSDFSICPYIEQEMWVVTYDDFCDRRFGLKRLYGLLTDDQKIFYKWYIYSNVHMKETFKDLIWDYLNGYDEQGKELMKKKRSYKPLKPR